MAGRSQPACLDHEEEGKVKEEKKYLAWRPQSRKICRREDKTKIEIRKIYASV